MPERFLLFNLSHIGDILFTTPAIRALKKSYPDCHITSVVLDGLADVLQNNPFIDRTISRKRGVIGSLGLVAAARSGSPTTSIAFSFSSVSTAAMSRASGAKRRVGFDRSGLSRFFTHLVPFRPDAHRVDLFLDLARAAGADLASPRMEMFLSDPDRDSAADILRASGADPGRPIVAISPGSTVHAKEWFPDRYGALADRLSSDGAQVVLVGSAGERATLDAVLASAKSSIIDLGGRTGIGELAAVLERCSIVVVGDTGPMHMAVAVGTAVVAIFGPTDARVFGPYGGDSVLLWENPGCSPCGYSSECRLECMDAITVDRVFEAASGLLCAGRGPR